MDYLESTCLANFAEAIRAGYDGYKGLDGYGEYWIMRWKNWYLYEKAEQLMEAVLYCIHEWEEMGCNSLISHEKIPAQRAYETGAAYVKEKTGKALNLYNRIMQEFYHYENQCLYDTFVKGIPEFFKWYDFQFEPQNTILNLDYPVLKDISEYTGG